MLKNFGKTFVGYTENNTPLIYKGHNNAFMSLLKKELKKLCFNSNLYFKHDYWASIYYNFNNGCGIRGVCCANGWII